MTTAENVAKAEQAFEDWKAKKCNIKQEERARQLERGLLVIEGMTYLYQDLDTYAKERGLAALVVRMQRFVDDVYEVAHASSGRCCKHPSFEKTIQTKIDNLKKLNIIDVEKLLDLPLKVKND